MGRGGTTKQTGVNRRTPSYSSDAIAIGGGGGVAPEMAQSCVINFTEELRLDGPSAGGVSKGLPINLVPGLPGTINIMSSGARLGSYDGQYKSQLLRCMRKKYIYRGTIVSSRAADGVVYAVCNIQGFGQL